MTGFHIRGCEMQIPAQEEAIKAQRQCLHVRAVIRLLDWNLTAWFSASECQSAIKSLTVSLAEGQPGNKSARWFCCMFKWTLSLLTTLRVPSWYIRMLGGAGRRSFFPLSCKQMVNVCVPSERSSWLVCKLAWVILPPTPGHWRVLPGPGWCSVMPGKNRVWWGLYRSESHSLVWV